MESHIKFIPLGESNTTDAPSINVAMKNAVSVAGVYTRVNEAAYAASVMFSKLVGSARGHFDLITPADRAVIASVQDTLMGIMERSSINTLMRELNV